MISEVYEMLAREIYSHYGFKSQYFKILEELGELIEALVKNHDGRDSDDHVCEELADCQIMIWQLSSHYGKDAVDRWIRMKISRQLDRIRESSDAAASKQDKEKKQCQQ